MESSGTCEVTIACSGEIVEVVVKDDGCGMDEATRARVFESFFTTKGAHGTGLGLYSVAVTARAAGGAVDVWSRPQQGTRVTLKLPRARRGRAIASQPETRARSGAQGRVLLAEDEPRVRRLLRRSLERAGFDVAEAADGDEAAALLGEPPPFDALCVDAIMPGRPTADVIETFRARSPTRPVLLMSGYLPGEIGEAMMSQPEITFVHKPFTGSALARVLANRLGEATR